MISVGIDARTISSPKTGDRTYALNLLHGLADLQLDAGQWCFHVLLDAPDEANLVPPSPCFEVAVVHAPNSRLWTLLALPLYARRARLDLIHVQYLTPAFSPCPMVTSIHDVVWRAMPETFPALHRTILTRAMPGSARRARAIICGSEAAKHDIARFLRVRRDKVTVTPYAVAPRFLQALQTGIAPDAIDRVRQAYGLGNAPYVLSVGVRQPRKNLARLQQAFVAVKTRHPNWPHNLVIVGKTGWGEEEESADPTVRYTGYVTDEDLPALYAGAEVFAYPSLYEGFGLPILEAMACGCPVLTSNRSSMPEAAGGMESGAARFVDPFSVDGIAHALEEILENAPLREKLRTKGRLHAALQTPQRQAEATLAVYKLTP